jgi:CBS domain containing-hemolysin-like protein
MSKVITVESIMTGRDEWYSCSPSEDKASVVHKLDEERVDQAPVIEPSTERIIGYVVRDELKAEIQSSKQLPNSLQS